MKYRWVQCHENSYKVQLNIIKKNKHHCILSDSNLNVYFSISCLLFLFFNSNWTFRNFKMAAKLLHVSFVCSAFCRWWCSCVRLMMLKCWTVCLATAGQKEAPRLCTPVLERKIPKHICKIAQMCFGIYIPDAQLIAKNEQ